MQLSFFSADASAPTRGDLAGVLCGRGQIEGFAGTAARVSVPVSSLWRARALAGEFALRGVDAVVGGSDVGLPLVRTAFRVDMHFLVAEWGHGGCKVVPRSFALTGAVLRMWVLAAGRPEDGARNRYLLGLDPRAPETHLPLVSAAQRAGIAASGVGGGYSTNDGEPVVRVTGLKRLRRLAELVGRCPLGADSGWPGSSGVPESRLLA